MGKCLWTGWGILVLSGGRGDPVTGSPGWGYIPRQLWGTYPLGRTGIPPPTGIPPLGEDRLCRDQYASCGYPKEDFFQKAFDKRKVLRECKRHTAHRVSSTPEWGGGGGVPCRELAELPPGTWWGYLPCWDLMGISPPPERTWDQ